MWYPLTYVSYLNNLLTKPKTKIYYPKLKQLVYHTIPCISWIPMHVFSMQYMFTCKKKQTKINKFLPAPAIPRGT